MGQIVECALFHLYTDNKHIDNNRS